jgi:hypothetical protein
MLIKTLTPLCPLCGDPFRLVVKNQEKWFTCWKCEICILTNDVCVGKWNDNTTPEDTDDLLCPVCRAKMKMFTRSDGYVKAVCPSRTCKAVVESDVPEDKFKFITKG